MFIVPVGIKQNNLNNRKPGFGNNNKEQKPAKNDQPTTMEKIKRKGMPAALLAAVLGAGSYQYKVNTDQAERIATLEQTLEGLTSNSGWNIQANQSALASTTVENIANVARQVEPSVVRITNRNYREGDRHGYIVGSGVLVRNNAGELNIITNYHVIAETSTLIDSLDENKHYEYELDFYGRDDTAEPVIAELVAYDRVDDLAVLRPIDSENIPDRSRPIQEFRDITQDPLIRGETVVSVGNMYGQEGTVTAGVLSNTGINTHMRVNLILTDASINTGNSGGPLVDLQGRPIGISNRTFNNTTMSTAIPMDEVRKFLDEHLPDEHPGIDIGITSEETDGRE